MDEEWFQQMEKRLNEQAEATWAMNETLNKFLAVMANQEAARNVATPPLVSPPHVTTPLLASQPSRVKLGVPSHLTEIERRDALSSHPASSISR
jgi:predicted alpha/beta hydrolase family esterase